MSFARLVALTIATAHRVVRVRGWRHSAALRRSSLRPCSAWPELHGPSLLISRRCAASPGCARSVCRKHVNARSRIRLKNQRGAEAMPYVVSTTVMSGFSVGGQPAHVASSLAP
jgi:hypothetical protein